MSKRPGNIAPETSYDPFPRAGLVKKYEPYIRNVVAEFCERYPRVPRDDLLCEAVRLACQAEKRFKPGLGNDFSTFLGGLKGRPGYLKGLHRFAKQQSWECVWSTPQDSNPAEEEDKLPAGDFYDGPNGARITLDLNGVKNRATLRVQLGSVLADRILALWDRASPDIGYLAQHEADPMVRIARIRAALDHHERRQDESEQEAENRSRGDFGSVFLEARARSGSVSLQLNKRRKPPNLNPDRIPMASLDDAYTHDEDWVGKLSDTIADGATPPSVDRAIIAAFEAERPFLNRREAPVADWLIGWLTGIDSRSLVQFADDQKISKGYASKLRDRVAAKVAARFKRNDND
jgi:hypothetical protein